MEGMPRDKRRSFFFEKELWLTLVLMAFGYVLLHDLLGGTLLGHSQWDSYTLQALAWRNGEASLGQNYPWLELAVYQGSYYVSFPPLPGVVMLPLTLLFGADTPNNLVMAVYAMLTVAFAYALLRLRGAQSAGASFAALFYVWGSNMLWMSLNGGVWFQAQALNLLLLTGTAYAALRGRRLAAYALTALAVGCRPFSAVIFLPLFVYFYRQDKLFEKGFFKTALMQARCMILPIAIAAAYMWYNFVRFDSPFEFGHKYLPEFLEAEHGQFSLVYLAQNLKNLFFRPIKLTLPALRLSFPFFDGFMFYIANPMFLLLFIKAVKDAFKKRLNAYTVSLLLAMAVSLVLLSAHKTLGGWQFGARYTVDLLPLALLYLVSGEAWELKGYQKYMALSGMLFNAYGALAMTFIFQ